MKSLFLYIVLIFTLSVQAQISISSAAVNGFTSAGQGDLYVDDNGVYYIGLEDGSLKEIGIVTQRGAADGEILTWSTAQNQWVPVAASTGDLSFEQEDLFYAQRARIRLNADNLNGNTHTLQPTTILYNDIGASINGNAVTNLEGNIRIWVQVNFNSTNERTNFNLVMKRNGTDYKRVFGSAYSRARDNHDQTSARFLFEYENAVLTDEFEFELEREANFIFNEVLIESNSYISSQILIEQYLSNPVYTELQAPPELSLVQGPIGVAGPTGLTGLQGPTVGEPTDVYHAAGKVNAAGFGLYLQGATVTRTSAGRYQVTFSTPFPNGANYPVIFSMEQNPGRDDYVATYNNVTANGFDVEIGEHDTGGNPSRPVDAGFSFYIPLSL